MKNLKKVCLYLIIILVLFASCAPAQKEADQAEPEKAKEDLITEITKRGVMRVGLSVFVPWSFKDKDGVLRGFEIDVATQLAEDLGVKVEFIPTEWSGLIPALLTGKFDVIIAGMGIVPERALKVNFTNPYDYSGMSINASKKIAPGRYTLEEFNKPDVVIAVRLGTTAVDAVKKYLPKAQMRQFDNEAECQQEVLNGRAHAVVASAPEPARWAKKNPNELYLPLKGEPFIKEPISFALKKGDPDTLAFFNAWITLKQWTGWLEEKHQYWFVGEDWNKYLEQ
ncbi:MAG TPA: transporter substrate-binding domain-containing protein [bacterium]|nr:transporter substrate-binding domain-containing protein [bacterium]